MKNLIFQKKYRVPSTRLSNWNYASSGYYFVTICTHNRECWFGKIVNRQMQLSKIGEIVAEEWQKTAAIRQNVKLGECVIMPNHLHGIIIVETHCNASLQPNKIYKNKFGPQSQNLSAIIRGFKSATTNRIHVAGYANFSWQPRFWEHIVRSEKSLLAISDYIRYNPVFWSSDSENPSNPKAKCRDAVCCVSTLHLDIDKGIVNI